MAVTRVAFSWNGLPQYGARLIRQAIAELGGPCAVIGTKPTVPVLGMEAALGQPVHWIDADSRPRWADLGLEPPEVFLQSGWAYPAFNALGADTKSHGGRVIGLMDNNWRASFRQLVLGPAGFRLLYRHGFDAMLVPGKSGRRLARYYGMKRARLRMGMYGADPALFYPEIPISQRPKEFLFVGRFTAIKGVASLCAGFIEFSKAHPEWTLRLCGSGEMRVSLPDHPGIIVEDFVQPEALRARYNRARFFILPSIEEAWGLVVHEAALCGSALILSDKIGSTDDLAGCRNSVRFAAGDSGALARALARAAAWTDARLEEAGKESRLLARRFGPARFADEVKRLVNSFAPR